MEKFFKNIRSQLIKHSVKSNPVSDYFFEQSSLSPYLVSEFEQDPVFLFSDSLKIDSNKLYSYIIDFPSMDGEDIKFKLSEIFNRDRELGVFKIPASKIFTRSTVYSLYDEVRFFFEFLDSDFDINKIRQDIKYDVKSTTPYNLPFGFTYIKYCFLTYQYITERKFRFPPTANYIKELDKWILHPGGFRSAIYQLFNDKAIEVIGLVGKDIPVKKFIHIPDLNHLETRFNKNSETVIDVALVGYGDQMLAQFPFDYDNYHSSFTGNFELAYSFFLNTSIESNFGFNRKASEEKTRIFIEIERPEDPILILKTLFVLPFLKKGKKLLKGIKVYSY